MAGSTPPWSLNQHVVDVLKRLKAHPFSSLVIAVLVLLPIGNLWLSDQQDGLKQDLAIVPDPLLQVSEGMRMLQSFRVDAAKPVPAIWIKLFDSKTASELWQQLDERIWWQAWPQDGDPLLILPETDVVLPSATAPLSVKRWIRSRFRRPAECRHFWSADAVGPHSSLASGSAVLPIPQQRPRCSLDTSCPCLDRWTVAASSSERIPWLLRSGAEGQGALVEWCRRITTTATGHETSCSSRSACWSPFVGFKVSQVREGLRFRSTVFQNTAS